VRRALEDALEAELAARGRGSADVVDPATGEIVGVAVWRAELGRWYAQSAVGGVRTREQTLDAVTQRLLKKIEANGAGR
jgi:broad-specificity NMP kinase